MSNTKVSSEQIIDDVALAGNPTTTTQSAGNNTTRVATTAFVTTAVSNLVDSAPSNLDTLNELAAAMNDNASFFSTVLPLSGGTMTGTLNVTGDGEDVIINSADYELVLIGNRGSSGANLDKAYLRMKSEGTNTIVLDADGFTYLSGGNVGVGQAFGGTVDELVHIEKSSGTTLFKAEVGGNSTVGLEIAKTGSTTQSWRIVDGQTVNGDLEIYDLTDSRLVASFNGAGNVKFTGLVGVNKPINAGVGLSVGSDASTSTSYALEVCNSNSNTRFLVDGLGSQRFYGSDNSETARFTEGKLGIGDNDPFAALEVNDTGWSSGAPYGTVVYVEGGGVNDLNWGHLVVSQSGTSTDTGGRISLGANGQNPIAGLRAKYKGATYGDLALLTRPSGGTNTENLLITHDGKIRLGAGVSPAANLEVGYADNENVQRWSYDSSRTNFYLELDTYIPAGGVVAYSFDMKVNGTAYNDTLTLDRGKVGVGTRSPSSGLHLQGADNTASKLTLTNTASNNTWSVHPVYNNQNLVFAEDGTARISMLSGGSLQIEAAGASDNAWTYYKNADRTWLFGIRGSASDVLSIYDLTADAQRMQVDSSGNIGAPTGTNIYNASDERLKQNISSLDNSLDIIKNLNPVKFNWIDNFAESENGKTLYGFVAQEVQDVFPDAVEPFGDGKPVAVDNEVIENPLTVREKFLVPLLVKAIQELEARIKTLEDK